MACSGAKSPPYVLCTEAATVLQPLTVHQASAHQASATHPPLNTCARACTSHPPSAIQVGILSNPAQGTAYRKRTGASWRPKRLPLSWTSMHALLPANSHASADNSTAAQDTRSLASLATIHRPSSSLPRLQQKAQLLEVLAQDRGVQQERTSLPTLPAVQAPQDTCRAREGRRIWTSSLAMRR